MTFVEIIQKGMENPDCSFWVGAAAGQWMAFKYLIVVIALYIVLRALEKLAIDPLLDRLKKRFWRAP